MKNIRLLFCVLISCLPLLYLAWIWKDLPGIVPTHFDMAGKPNDFSSKSTLWVITGFMAALTIGLYLLFNNLHIIDPKRKGTAPSASFARLADGLVLFFSVLNFIVLLASSGHEIMMTRLLFPLMGLLFVFLGNMMFSLKPNYFAGIRVPWTLADDDNWRATHRIGGIVWFLGGVAIIIGSFLVGERYSVILLFAALIPMIVIPVAYSFWYFKRSAQKNN